MKGPRWSKEEIGLLYVCAESMSQAEAAKRIGRSVGAVADKARALGFRWHQECWTARDIAATAGCAHHTAIRMIRILWPDKRPQCAGARGRYLLTPEQAERVIRVIKGTRKRRHQQIEAGKKSQARTAMRKRIQHPRKQRPSRVQIERQTGPGGTRYAARIDHRLMIDARTEAAAWFRTATEAEAEAHWCLACRHLDAAGWKGLGRYYDSGTAPDDQTAIDLGDLGFVGDDLRLTAAGRAVGRRYVTEWRR